MRLYIPLPALWSTFGDLIDASSCHSIYYEKVIIFCKIFAFAVTELLITLGDGGGGGGGVWELEKVTTELLQGTGFFQFLPFICSM